MKTIELLARYGGKASIYSQLEVQQLINQEWVKIGETSIDENNYNKPTRYIINVNDLSEDIRLRLYYNGDNASAAVRIHDVIVHAPSLGIAMNLEARNIQEDGFEIQWEHAMLANNYEIVVSKRNSIENAELIVNGDAELSEDATWIFTNAEISSDKKYQGNNAFYLSSTTSYAGILQKVSVEPLSTWMVICGLLMNVPPIIWQVCIFPCKWNAK